jgi:hypothetical protein
MADFEQEHIGSVAMGDEVEKIWSALQGRIFICGHRETFKQSFDFVLTAALSRPAQEPAAVKPLEWIGNEARSSLGDLYSVQQLSPNVWTTYMNGTAFPGWKAVRSSAMAVAQENDTRRAAPQPAHGTSATERVPSDRLMGALTKINDIRNSIIGCQTVNWSEHIYPLVAALEEAGIEGAGYPASRANVGTMLERTLAAENEVIGLRTALEKIASPTQTTDLLWWQIEARAALAASEGSTDA